MKKPISLMLTLVFLATLLAGCGTTTTSAPETIKETVVVKESVQVPVRETVVVKETVEVTGVAEKEAETATTTQEWELVVPEGVLAITPIDIAARIDTLEGKTVGLKWNGKPNGNLFLDRVAELLQEQVKDVKIIKFYEVETSTILQSASTEDAQRKAQLIATYKPDIVIGSQCD